MALLVHGLLMDYAPDAVLSQALPASLRVVGGSMFAAGWAGMRLSLLEHRRN